jgi:hypothetical protein
MALPIPDEAPVMCAVCPFSSFKTGQEGGGGSGQGRGVDAVVGFTMVSLLEKVLPLIPRQILFVEGKVPQQQTKPLHFAMRTARPHSRIGGEFTDLIVGGNDMLAHGLERFESGGLWAGCILQESSEWQVCQ